MSGHQRRQLSTVNYSSKGGGGETNKSTELHLGVSEYVGMDEEISSADTDDVWNGTFDVTKISGDSWDIRVRYIYHFTNQTSCLDET